MNKSKQVSDLSAFAAFLVACVEKRAELDPKWMDRVAHEFRRVARLRDEAREKGITLDAGDVAGLGTFGVFAKLLPHGAVTRTETAAARLCAVALALLAQPDEMMRGGFLPFASAAPRETLAYAETRFGAWTKAASASIVDLKAPLSTRDGVVRGFMRHQLGETPDAERHAAQTRAVARRMSAKGFNIDADEVDNALTVALDADGKNPDGLIRYGDFGFKLDERRARDLLARDDLRPSGDVSLDDEDTPEQPTSREQDPTAAAQAAETSRKEEAAAAVLSAFIAELRGETSDPAMVAAIAHLQDGEPLKSAADRLGVGRKKVRNAVERVKDEGRRRLGRAAG